MNGISTLADAHDTLDQAVAAAYAWEWSLSEDEALSRLLALNLERAAAEQIRPNSSAPHQPGLPD